MLYQNVRGLNSKLRQTYLKSFGSDFKVFIFTETWFKPEIYDTGIFSDRFEVCRNYSVNRTGYGQPRTKKYKQTNTNSQ